MHLVDRVQTKKQLMSRWNQPTVHVMCYKEAKICTSMSSFVENSLHKDSNTNDYMLAEWAKWAVLQWRLTSAAIELWSVVCFLFWFGTNSTCGAWRRCGHLASRRESG